MTRLIRCIAAIAASYLLIYGIDSIAGYGSWWLSLIICLSCGYLIIYTGRSYHTEERTVRKEYILNLHTNQIGDLFLPSKYPNYKLQHSGYDGNDYMSKSGAVICTKFVDSKQIVKVKDGGIAIHLFCILICVFAFLLWSSVLSSGQLAELSESHSRIVAGNFHSLFGEGAGTFSAKLGALPKIVGAHVSDLFSRIAAGTAEIRFIPAEQGRNLIQGWQAILSRVIGNIAGIFGDIKNAF